jgi:hypothetical protein
MDKNKVLWHTIKLRIPSEMISIGKNGVMTVKQSLTKKNNIAKRLKEPSVILESDPNITEAKIIDKGDVENVNEIKERQGKLKRIRKKLETLPNKPPTTKEEFVEMAQKKAIPRVAQRKTMKSVSKEIENANQHKEIKEHFKDFEDKIHLSDPKFIMNSLESDSRGYKTIDQLNTYEKAYYFGYPYYNYLRNNAHKEELFKRYGIKQMPKFTPSPLLLKVYNRFKKVYEAKDKDSEDRDINYQLQVEKTIKDFEPLCQKLRDEYKAGTRRKSTINKNITNY